MRQFPKIMSEGNGNGGHAAGLDHQEQSPPINKGDAGVVRFAKIGVLSAHFRKPRSKLCIDERSGQGDYATEDPRPQDRKGSVNLAGNNIWIDKDPRAEHPAHYDHCGVEKSKASVETMPSTFGPDSRRTLFISI